MTSKQPTATHLGRKRVEERNPKMVDELLQYAAAHGASVYAVHPRTIARAMERHFTAQLRDELAEANEQVERLLDQCSDTEQELARALDGQKETEKQLALVRADLADAYEQLEKLHGEYTDAGCTLRSESGDVAELQNALTATLVELSLHREPLYAVQLVTDLSHTANAVQSGALVGLLDGQLVTVRPVHVHDGSGVVVWQTVSAEGASMCTAAALLAAGLPVPAGAQ